MPELLEPLSRKASLPVLLAGLLLLLLILAWLERRRRTPQEKRVAARVTGILLLGYAAGYVFLTFLYRRPAETPSAEMFPFWSYREAFGPGLTIARLGVAREILLNILLYVPLGLLLPAVLREEPGWLTPVIGAGLSFATEFLQYVTRLGFAELDDCFNNILGCVAGLVLFRLLQRLTAPRAGA